MSQPVNHVHGNVPEQRTYKVEEIAQILNIGRTSAYNLVKEGHFKTVRVGNAIRISKKSFDEWLDAQGVLTNEERKIVYGIYYQTQESIFCCLQLY